MNNRSKGCTVVEKVQVVITCTIYANFRTVSENICWTRNPCRPIWGFFLKTCKPTMVLKGNERRCLLKRYIFYSLQMKAQYTISVNTNNKSKWCGVAGLICVVLGSKCRADPDKTLIANCKTQLAAYSVWLLFFSVDTI